MSFRELVPPAERERARAAAAAHSDTEGGDESNGDAAVTLSKRLRQKDEGRQKKDVSDFALYFDGQPIVAGLSCLVTHGCYIVG